MSTGRFVPVGAVPGAPSGGGACLPLDVAAGIKRESARYQVHVFSGVAGLEQPLREAQADERASDAQLAKSMPACDTGGRFRSFASFAWYSPLPYVPQAAAVALVRVGGGGVVGMLLAARLACLLAYVGVAWVAIRRAPVGRWALGITALLPAALFQGATSVSPDALTTAMALLVISSALRMTASAEPRLPRAFLVEAVLLSVALGLCKPSYVVVALCYLLPLLSRSRRRAYWPLGIAVAAGIGVSTLWQTTQSHLFVCDNGFFGVQLDPSRQRHAIATNPLRLVGAGCRALVDYRGKWERRPRHHRRSSRRLARRSGSRRADRVPVPRGAERNPVERFGVAVAASASSSRWCSSPRTSRSSRVGSSTCETPPVHVGITRARAALRAGPRTRSTRGARDPDRGRFGRLAAGRVPITLVLIPFEIAWLIALVTQMR